MLAVLVSTVPTKVVVAVSIPHNEFDAKLKNILIDHDMDLADRRRHRTPRKWPDESDIYGATVMRIRELFEKADDDTK